MSTRDVPESLGNLPKIGRPATSALISVGVGSLSGVARMSRGQLLALHGVGPKAVRLLADALAEAGLSFADDEATPPST